MCIYMCECIYVYEHVYIYIYIYICICIYIYIATGTGGGHQESRSSFIRSAVERRRVPQPGRHHDDILETAHSPDPVPVVAVGIPVLTRPPLAARIDPAVLQQANRLPTHATMTNGVPHDLIYQWLGAFTSVSPRVPSWPKSLLPQTQTTPVSVRAQKWLVPAATITSASPAKGCAAAAAP